MNKIAYAAIGTVFGAAGGSILTYFLTKAKTEDWAADQIEDYAVHCSERVETLQKEIAFLKAQLGVIEEPHTRPVETDDEEDNTIRNNEGVKKYHHYDGEELPEYASKRIFKKVTKEEEMAKKEVKNVHELAEGVFLDSGDGYDKQTIDVLFRYQDDKVEEIWGYKTDNETPVKERFGKGLIDLIGIDGEDMLDWVEPDEGTAVKYFRNMDLGTDFEIVVHCDPDTYYDK